MNLCFSTLGCPRWTFEEIITTAKDLGYNGVEIRGVGDEMYAPKINEFSSKNIQKTKNRLKEIGLTIPCLTSQSELQNKSRCEDSFFEAKEYIDLAVELDVPFIRVLGDRHPKASPNIDEVYVFDMAQKIGEYAKNAGKTVLIESNGFYADSEKLATLLQKINMDSVQALWDVHHPFRFMHEAPKTTYDNLKTYLKHVHLKDSLMVDNDYKYKLVGMGDIPVKQAVEACLDGGYKGYFCLEWVRRWDLTLEEPGIAFDYFVNYMNN